MTKAPTSRSKVEPSEVHEAPHREPSEHRASIFGVSLAIAGVALTLVYELAHLSGFAYGQALYPVDNYDEGVYLATGDLVAHSYSLYSDVYSAQPPILPSALSISERIFGMDPAGGRGMILAFALVLLVAVFCCGALLGDRISGGVSVALLAVSPEFLVYAHAIEEEVPMLALSAASLAAALWWRRSGRPVAVVLAGICFGLAILTKFFAFGLLAPLALILILGWWEDIRAGGSGKKAFLTKAASGAIFLGAGAVPVAASFLLWGTAEWDQMIGDRISAASHSAGLGAASNIHQVGSFAGTDYGLAAGAVVGGLLLLLVDWKAAVILGSWLMASLILVLRYHPLMGHHPVILLAPAALLAGSGIGKGISGLRTKWPVEGSLWTVPPATFRLAVLLLIAVWGVAYAAGIPHLVTSYTGLLIAEKADPYGQALDRAARIVESHTTSRDLVAASDAWICVKARRLCVPGMVDSSYVRVETGRLTGNEAIHDVRQSHARAVVLGRALCPPNRTLGTRGLTGLEGWVKSHFREVQRIPNLQAACGGVFVR